MFLQDAHFITACTRIKDTENVPIFFNFSDSVINDQEYIYGISTQMDSLGNNPPLQS